MVEDLVEFLVSPVVHGVRILVRIDVLLSILYLRVVIESFLRLDWLAPWVIVFAVSVHYLTVEAFVELLRTERVHVVCVEHLELLLSL